MIRLYAALSPHQVLSTLALASFVVGLVAFGLFQVAYRLGARDATAKPAREEEVP